MQNITFFDNPPVWTICHLAWLKQWVLLLAYFMQIHFSSPVTIHQGRLLSCGFFVCSRRQTWTRICACWCVRSWGMNRDCLLLNPGLVQIDGAVRARRTSAKCWYCGCLQQLDAWLHRRWLMDATIWVSWKSVSPNLNMRNYFLALLSSGVLSHSTPRISCAAAKAFSP